MGESGAAEGIMGKRKSTGSCHDGPHWPGAMLFARIAHTCDKDLRRCDLLRSSFIATACREVRYSDDSVFGG